MNDPGAVQFPARIGPESHFPQASTLMQKLDLSSLLVTLSLSCCLFKDLARGWRVYAGLHHVSLLSSIMRGPRPFCGRHSLDATGISRLSLQSRGMPDTKPESP